MLKNNGYNVKVLNLIDMAKSDCYNPFRYIRTENDVIKLVTNIISNTTPKEAAPTDSCGGNAFTGVVLLCMA